MNGFLENCKRTGQKKRKDDQCVAHDFWIDRDNSFLWPGLFCKTLQVSISEKREEEERKKKKNALCQSKNPNLFLVFFLGFEHVIVSGVCVCVLESKRL